MSRASAGTLTGLAVLVSGVVTILGLTGRGPEPDPAVGSTTSTVVTPQPSLAPLSTDPSLPGVSAAVTRTLQRAGNADLADAGELAQLPESVSSVLIEFGVPLRVATSEERP